MTTPTTPETTRQHEHLSAIRGTAAWMREAIQMEPDPGNRAELDKSLRIINRHAEAMEEQVVAERERGDRLQAALVAQGWYAQALRAPSGSYASEEIIRRRDEADRTAELCWKYGDMRGYGDLLPDPETNAGGDAR